jgi:threonine dehydratase/serine racemase
VSERGPFAVSAAEIAEAAARIRPFVFRTPTIPCPALTARTRRPVHLKLESTQRTGSFKIRGATNAVRRIADADAGRGVVTHSSGNHALALATAAADRGIPCRVVMPSNASPMKRAAVEAAGATVVTSGDTAAEREAKANEVQAATGATMVPPYDHPWTIAGQGTIALEILADLPEAATLVVPVGGGGLIGGIAIAAKALRPDLRIVGAEPELADDAAESKRTGRLAAQRPPVTVADGLRAPLGRLTFPIVASLVDEIVTVPETEIVSAMRLVMEEARLVIEPSAAVGVAAIVAGGSGGVGGDASRPLACVLCGGNVDLSRLPWLSR